MLRPRSLLAWPYGKLLNQKSDGGEPGAQGVAAPRSGRVRDRLSDVLRPPGLRDEGDVGWHLRPAHIAGGEHDLEIRAQTLGCLGQFGAAHAGHAYVREQHLDLRMSPEKLQGLLTVVGVEHRTAEVLEQLDRDGADLGHVLHHENGNLYAGQLTIS